MVVTLQTDTHAVSITELNEEAPEDATAAGEGEVTASEPEPAPTPAPEPEPALAPAPEPEQDSKSRGEVLRAHYRLSSMLCLVRDPTKKQTTQGGNLGAY